MSDFETWTSAKPVKPVKVLSVEERQLLPTAKRWGLTLLRGIAFCILAPIHLLIYIFTHLSSSPVTNTSNDTNNVENKLFKFVEDQYHFHDTSSPGFVGPRKPVWADNPPPFLHSMDNFGSD